METSSEIERVTASPFVGQSSTAGNDGSKEKGKKHRHQEQTQKEQQAIVEKFRRGDIDVLVATCIGEEGLDIGSVDLIVSYDAVSSPIRMIQRFGRADVNVQVCRCSHS